MGILYVVPTPIGNLEDITLRAINVLKNADVVLAEDTRTSSVLLKHLGIKKEMFAYHKFNEHQITQKFVDWILNGKNVALVSDAGTPAISDPGFLLVRECAKHDIQIVTLPGPTAFVPALVSSALPCDRFCFEGFLPQKKGRKTKLEELMDEKRTMIFYESPFRVKKTLQQFAEVFGEDRGAACCREISKIHEQTIRGSLAELIQYYGQTEPKGEFVIIVEGKSSKEHKNNEPIL